MESKNITNLFNAFGAKQNNRVVYNSVVEYYGSGKGFSVSNIMKEFDEIPESDRVMIFSNLLDELNDIYKKAIFHAEKYDVVLEDGLLRSVPENKMRRLTSQSYTKMTKIVANLCK